MKTIRIASQNVLVPKGFFLFKLRTSKFRVCYNGREHHIIGVRPDEAADREWYVTDLGEGRTRCSDPVDAINLIIDA